MTCKLVSRATAVTSREAAALRKSGLFGSTALMPVAAALAGGVLLLAPGQAQAQSLTPIGSLSDGGGSATLCLDLPVNSCPADGETTGEQPIPGDNESSQILRSSLLNGALAPQISISDSLITYADGEVFTGGIVTSGTANLNIVTGTATQAGVLAGLNFAKIGLGTLILTFNNSYVGTTTISEGTLQIGAGGTTGTLGTGAVTNNAALVFNRSDDIVVVGNAISGTGNLTKRGNGVLALTGDNDFSGTTTIVEGILQIGNGGTTGSLGTGDVVNLARLAVDRSNDFTFANAMTGIGLLNKGGAGTMTVTGALSHIGGTNVFGGTLVIAETGSLSGGGPVSIGGGNLTLNNAVSSVREVSQSSGDLTLNNGARLDIELNSYNHLGGNILGTGTIQLLNDSRTFTVGGTAGSISSGITITGSNALGNAFVLGNVTGDYALQARITGAAMRLQLGNTGDVTTISGNNTFGGGTSLNSGTVVVANDSALGTGALTMASNTTLLSGGTGNRSLANNIVLNGTGISIGNPNAGTSFTLGGVISGEPGLTVTGVDRVILTGANTYSGGTIIAGGPILGSILQLGSGALAGSLGSGNVTINSGARLISISSANQTILGALSGAGSLTQLGSGTLTLNSASPTFSGLIFLNAGAIEIATANALGTGGIALLGGDLITTSTMTVGNGFSLGGGNNSRLRPSAGTVLTVTGSLEIGGDLRASGGAGSVIRLNTPSVSLIAAANVIVESGTLSTTTGGLNTVISNVSGQTRIESGATLDLNGAFALISNLQGAGTLLNGSETTVLRGGNFSGSINGGQSIVIDGDVSLSGNNAYTGTTTVQSGTLTVGSNNALGTAAGGTTVNSGATLQFGGSSLSIGDALTISGSGNGGIGAVRVVNTTGGTTAQSTNINGAVSLAAASLITITDRILLRLIGPVQLGTSTLTINHEDTVDATTRISGAISGTGGLIKNGGGILDLIGTNTFTGPLTINAGDVILGFGAALADTAAVNTASGSRLFIEASETIGSLAGAGTVTLFNGSILTTGGNNVSTTLSGNILSNGGLTKVGTGTFTLTGTNSAIGTTTISAGALQIGNGGTTGAITGGPIVNNASLIFNRSDALTHSGVISGTGTLTKLGTGTTVLTGNSSYSGTTTITAGTLQIGDGGTSGPIGGGAIINNANLAYNRSDNTTFVNAISGTGTFTKLGTGRLTLSGTGTFTGATFINAGVLELGSSVAGILNSLGVTSSIQIGNATLAATLSGSLDRNITIAADAAAGIGALDGTAMTLSGAFTLLDGGKLTFGGPAYTGTVDLAPTTFNAFGRPSSLVVSGGTLRLGNNAAAAAIGRFTGGATIGTGASSATLDLNSTVDPLLYNLSGTSAGRIGNSGPRGSILTLENTRDTTFAGNIGGIVFLRKKGAGTLTLTGVSTTPAQFDIDGGTLQIGNGGTSGSIEGNNNIRVNAGGTLTFNRSDNTSVGGLISGSGTLTKLNTNTLAARQIFNFSGALNVNAGVLQVGEGTAQSVVTGGTMTIGTGATVRLAGSANHSFAGNIVGAGALVMSGTGAVTVSGAANTFSGGTTINSGALQIGNGGTTGGLGSGTVSVNSGAQLTFSRSDAVTFANLFTGAGTITKNLLNTLTLTGSNTAGSAFTGAVNVNAGTLLINGEFGDLTGRTAMINVLSGGTLGGIGTIQGNVIVAADGILAPGNSPGTQTIAGNLTLQSGAILDFELAPAGVVGGGINDLINVGGNLTLAGALRVTALPGFSAGYYRLFNYGGTLTNNGLTFGTTPAGFTGELLTNIAGQVNVLFNTGAQLVQYWDGTDLTGALATVNGEGGAGTWSATSTNWTSPTGFNVNGAWGGQLGIFAGAAGGVVSLSGAQAFQELRFQTNGYALRQAVLGSGSLSTTGGFSIIDMASGINATIAVPISGAAGLTKTGAGTLTLDVSNIYSGTTTIAAGTLQIGNGGLTGSLNSASAIINNGTLIYNRSNSIVVGNTISGTGAVRVTGPGFITLTGNNSYGATFVDAGSLQVGNGGTSGTLGTGAVTNNGQLFFNRSDLLTVSDAISGTGRITNSGTGTVVLTGANSYAGGTTVLAGQITAASNSALGASSGGTTVNAGATLGLQGGITIANSFAVGGEGLGGTGALRSISGNNTVSGPIGWSVSTRINSDAGLLTLNGPLSGSGSSTLTIGGAGDTRINGVISGAAGLVKDGTGTLTLSGNNTAASNFTGTINLNAGTLLLNGSIGDAVGNSAILNVASGTTLGGSGTFLGSVNIGAGGRKAPGASPGTLAIGGNLLLDAGSILNFELAQAGVVGSGINDLITVAGNLTLAGTLNITALPGFGPGIYRLFNYGGTLANNGLMVGAVPAGYVQNVLTGVAGQVSIQFTFGTPSVLYWDGVETGGGPAVVNGLGGPGIWNATSTNWTSAPDFAFNYAWGGETAVFSGAAGGEVQVSGTQAFQQLRFETDGYSLTAAAGGGGLATTGGTSIISVSTGLGARIDTVIQGTAGLTKAGAGMLTLGGANTFSGLTSVAEGSLALTTGGSLAGAVQNAATFTNAGTVSGLVQTLAGGTTTNTGTFAGGANNAGTLISTGRIDGGLTNSGTTNLSGGFSGTIVNSGTITLLRTVRSTAALAQTASGIFDLGGNGAQLGSLDGAGQVRVGNARLQVGSNNASTTFAGVISGNGSVSTLAKVGTGTLTLTGANSFSGTTEVLDGSLVIASGASLGGVVQNSANFSNAGQVAGLVQNFAGATMTNTGTLAGSVINGGTLVSTFAIEGDFTNTGTATLRRVVNGSIGNAGTITLSGQLRTRGALNQAATGIFDIANSLGVFGGLSGGGQIRIGTGTLNVTNNAASRFDGVISGSGTFIFDGTETLTLGGTNTFNGLTSIRGGSLTLAAGARLGGSVENSGTLTNAGTIGGSVENRFRLTSTGTINGDLINGATATLSGRVNGSIIGSGTVTLSGGLRVGGTVELVPNGLFDLANRGASIGGLAGRGDVRIGSGILTINGDTTTTFAGLISGTGFLNKFGGGTLNLISVDRTSGIHTFTGLTSIDGGALVLGEGVSLAGSVQNNTSFTNAGTVSGIVRTSVGSATINTGTFAGGAINGGTLTSTGIINGELSNNGRAVLAGRINGSFVNSANASLSGALTVAGAFTQAISGTFSLGNLNAALGSLAGAGAIQLQTGNLSVGSNNASTLFSGVISGAGNLFKVGTGTLTLTGTNTFTGVTVIDGGTLVIGQPAVGTAAALAAAPTGRADAPLPEGVIRGAGLPPLVSDLVSLPGAVTLASGSTGMDGPLPTASATSGAGITLPAATREALPSGGRIAYLAAISGGPAQVELSGGPALAAASAAINPVTPAVELTAPSDFGLMRDVGNGAAIVQLNEPGGITASAPGGEAVSAPASAVLAEIGGGAATAAAVTAFVETTPPTTAVIAGNIVNNANVINNGVIRGAVINRGTLTSVGTIGGGLDNSGTARISGIVTGTVINSGSITLTGATTGIGFLEQAASGVFDLAGIDTTIGSLSGAGRIVLGAGRLTTGVNGVNTLFSGVISGNGSLTKTGNGSLILTGANTYAGGTTIAGGILQIGNGGTSGSIVGPVLNNGVFIINRSDAVTFAGAISGSGTFVQAGTGTTTLTGANSYRGGTLISGGRLIGSTVSLQGLIQNDAALEFAQATNGIFAGQIFGTGLFDKTGAGLLELTGDSSGLRGASTVSAGELRINGSLAGSLTTVLSGATLSGNGIVGGLVARSGATVVPGADGLGVLGVNGGVQLQNGSTLRLQVQALQGADAIISSGAVQLGGTAAITNLGGTFAFNSRYVLLQTNGTRTGTFDAVTGLADFGILYRPELLYTANQVVLRMAPNLLTNIVGSTPLTPNQRAVVSVIDTAVAAGYNPQPLFNIYALPNAQLPNAFDQLSGEVYATAAGVGIEQERLVREAVLGRTAEVAFASRQAPERGTGAGAWGQMFGGWGQGDRTANAARYENDRTGFITGIDYGRANDEGSWRIGTYGFFMRNRVSIDARGSRAEVDQAGGGIYAAINAGGFSAAVGGSLADVELNAQRTILLPGFAEANRGRTDGRALQGFAEISYAMTGGKFVYRTFVNMALGSFKLDALNETGGAAALAVARQAYNSGSVTAGVDGSLQTGRLRLSGMLAGRAQIGDRDPAARVALLTAPGERFAVSGVQLDDVALSARLDASVAVSKSADLSVGYTGLIGSKTTDHAVRATFSVRF